MEINTVNYAAVNGATPSTSCTSCQHTRKTFDSLHDGMRQGWGGTMDQLADYLAEARQG